MEDNPFIESEEAPSEKERSVFKYWPQGAYELLKQNNAQAFIWKVFEWCEAYFYASNRYSDDMAKHLAPTTAIITKIVGLCYRCFKTDPVYAKAWMAQKLMILALKTKPGKWVKTKNGREYIDPEDTDIVLQWIEKQNIHHDIRLRQYDDKKLYADFVKFRPYWYLSTMDRFEIIFTFIGARYHYEHQHRQLLEMAAKNPAGVDMKRLKALCKRCSDLKAAEEAKKEEFPSERYCNFTGEHFVPYAMIPEKPKPKPKSKQRKR